MTIGLRPEHLRFGDAGFAGRIAQIEPMGREILYVVDTGVGTVRVLEQSSSTGHASGEEVKIGFLPQNSLVFETARQKLIVDAHIRPPA